MRAKTRQRISLLLSIAGVLVLLASLWKGFEQYTFYLAAKRIKGVVAEVENKTFLVSSVPGKSEMARGNLKTVREVSFPKLKVHFKDETGAAREEWIPSGGQKARAGDEVSLLFDEKSHRLLIDSFFRLWSLPLILGCSAFFLILMGDTLRKRPN